ncbi:hypothetical protein [Anaerotruncus colihominis]|uniref:hypothetical protein n=1 Tax=Anaerotruncus colihominis TaxID=169435 RepID=UPI0018AC73DB|nr:hypothetical protein [Anaerotruncus colihominis]
MKRKITAILLATAFVLSLSACGQQQPSLEEVEQAIEEGNLTVEDALDKGWITQEWVDEYETGKSIPFVSKIDAGTIGDFVSTTLSGEEFTKEQMGDVTLFAFLDPTDPDATAFFQSLLDGYEGVKENGAEILVCTKSEDGNELFVDAPFPIIFYNDSLKTATEKHKGMIEDMPNAASWCVNGSFLSAWYSTAEAEDLADSAASFVEMQKEMFGDNNSDDGGMAVIG